MPNRDWIIVFGSFYTVADVQREEATPPTSGCTALAGTGSRAERHAQGVPSV